MPERPSPRRIFWRGPLRKLISGFRSFLRDPTGQVILSAAVTMIAVGTVFYRFVEELRWLDALYFCVITLASVGYGDITPTTNAGKIFTMGYVVLGIGIFVALVTSIAQHLLAAGEETSGQRGADDSTS
ncbi:MAG: potassium channel family protein [Actinomycetota bacterium]